MTFPLVIPVYNERDNLVPLEEKIRRGTKLNLRLSYEIILIDDGSVDGSPHIIKLIQETQTSFKINSIRKKSWAVCSIRCRVSKPQMEKYFITLDADMQNNPADIPVLLEKMKDFDVVCGWRFKRNDPWIKRDIFKNR